MEAPWKSWCCDVQPQVYLEDPGEKGLAKETRRGLDDFSGASATAPSSHTIVKPVASNYTSATASSSVNKGNMKEARVTPERLILPGHRGCIPSTSSNPGLRSSRPTEAFPFIQQPSDNSTTPGASGWGDAGMGNYVRRYHSARAASS